MGMFITNIFHMHLKFFFDSPLVIPSEHFLIPHKYPLCKGFTVVYI